ncbi:MAG: flagellar export chaperone FliS [Bdellovibrionales bacterium]|nr:flagellar export chaperone FliS [Bdellovibrionales bacterium]
MSKNPFQKYKNTSVESASKEKLLLMMYEGAIKYVKKAILAIEQGNIAERGINIGYAYDVIMELNNTLNHEVGGEVAMNLEQLYLFMTNELIKANIKADKEKLQSVLKILETLYEGWVQAIEKLKKEATAS